MVKSFLSFVKDIIRERKLIFELAKNDFKAKYAGSFLGVVWAFVQPLVTVLVMWFVFEKGFRSKPVDDVPFILWFVPAYIPWIFFSDMLASTTNCLYEYSYLVKKVKFRVSVLPIVKIMSATFVHLFFIAFIFAIYVIYGWPIGITSVQCIYYSAALIFFTVGLSWMLSALSVFFKDLTQLVNVVLQIGFWVTPIFWNDASLTPFVGKLLKLNPLYYIVRGYRDSFLYGVPFWQRVGTSTYFGILSIICFMVGALIFKRLRPHFADEL